MKLQSIRIKGLKCYKDSGVILFYNSTVFIGENDAGKSTILDALDLLLNNKIPKYNENEVDSDFRTDSDNIELAAVFSLKKINSEIKKFTINDMRLK